MLVVVYPAQTSTEGDAVIHGTALHHEQDLASTRWHRLAQLSVTSPRHACFLSGLSATATAGLWLEMLSLVTTQQTGRWQYITSRIAITFGKLLSDNTLAIGRGLMTTSSPTARESSAPVAAEVYKRLIFLCWTSRSPGEISGQFRTR